MDVKIERLKVVTHPRETILVHNIYYTDFNHQNLVVTIGDYLVKTSGILIHYVLCLGSIFAQDEEALRRPHLADSNIKLAMAENLELYS